MEEIVAGTDGLDAVFVSATGFSFAPSGPSGVVSEGEAKLFVFVGFFAISSNWEIKFDLESAFFAGSDCFSGLGGFSGSDCFEVEGVVESPVAKLPEEAFEEVSCLRFVGER